MRSIVLKIAVILILIGLPCWYHRDSLRARYSPLRHGTQKMGVVLFDHLRAQSDNYNIMNDYIDQPSCTVMDMEGHEIFSFPKGFCHFYADHSLLILGNEITLYDATGRVLWSLPTDMHHDFDVTADEQEIFYIGEERSTVKGRPARTDTVHGLNRAGQNLFTWKFNDHLEEIDKILGAPANTDDRDGFWAGHRILSHMNSIQVLPDHFLAGKIPAFKRGNLLVNDFGNRMIFVIERETGKIVWSKVFRDIKIQTTDPIIQRGVHTVRLLPNGNLLYFHNLQGYSYTPTKFSSIEEFNPVKSQLDWRYIADPVTNFIAEIWGSAFRLTNGNTLITYSAAGSAFEVAPSGRVVWEWINPRRDPWGLAFPIYRVTRVPKTLVDPVLKVWQMNH